jgi:hypothetical protein
MVNPVDFGRSCAVAPGEAAAFDLCLSSALADQAVVGTAGEEQVVGVGRPAIAPFCGVMNFTLIARLMQSGWVQPCAPSSALSCWTGQGRQPRYRRTRRRPVEDPRAERQSMGSVDTVPDVEDVQRIAQTPHPQLLLYRLRSHVPDLPPDVRRAINVAWKSRQLPSATASRIGSSRWTSSSGSSCNP